MDAIWVGLGITVLGLSFLDVFLTALNYDESGFFSSRLARWQWSLTRRITRRMSRRWRPVALRQVTGLQIMATVLAWLGGVILGFGLIYRGLMQGQSFLYSGVNADFFSAIYFSMAQLSAVGTSQLTANTDVLRILSTAETLTGVVLVLLILTFLLGIYDVISNLRELSAQFPGGRKAGDPIASLEPYFPGGKERGLDSHLQSISDSFSSYSDGVRLHDSAYYFQSGRDTFSLPYSIRMMAGVIGGLRWGLPHSNPVTQEPTLLPLTEQFELFESYMHPLLNWTSTAVPETVEPAEFRRVIALDAELHAPGVPAARQEHVAETSKLDDWVCQFAYVNRKMAALVQSEPFLTGDEAYQRYVSWLPFAYRAHRFTQAISHDLDYQPVFNTAAPESSEPGGTAAVPQKHRQFRGKFLSHRMTLVDPGKTRFLASLRTLAASAGTVAVVGIVLAAAGLEAIPAAVFGGMIAMYAGRDTGQRASRTGIARFSGLVALIPVSLAVGLNAVVPQDPFSSSVVLAGLAFAGMALTPFGKVLRGMGQLAFFTFYYSLLLQLKPADSWLYAAAGFAGVVISVLIQAIPDPKAPTRILVDGVNAFEQRMALLINPLIDAVAAARWDPDLARRTQAELKQIHRESAFLAGRLSGDASGLGLSAGQGNALRLRVFDAEIAAVNLAAAAREATGTAVPLKTRAQLAGELEQAQERILRYAQRPLTTSGHLSSDGTPASGTLQPLVQAPVGTSTAARRLQQAVIQASIAAEALQNARAGDLGAEQAEGTTPAAFSDAAPEPAQPSPAPMVGTAWWRRPTQAALATGLALWAGTFVSTSHQYWAAMPAFQVLGGTDGETYVKAVQRIAGTVAGAAVGFGLAISLGSHIELLLAGLALCVFATTFFRSVSAPLAAFWQTMLFAELYEVLGKLDTETIEVRLLETVIGAVFALAVAALIWPTHTRSKLAADTSRFVQTAKEASTMCLARLKAEDGASADDSAKFAGVELAMTQQLRQVERTAAPLRRSWGALDTRGIEGHLTACWALLYYTHRLIENTQRFPGPGDTMTPDQWREVRETVDDNFDSLLNALAGRLSGAVHDQLLVAGFESSQQSRDLDKALRSLERIVQTTAVLVQNIQPVRNGSATAPLPPTGR